jgi:quercetin dioxygenase-like cupin family protein
MPVIPGATAPTFELPMAQRIVFTGLAAPSRGALETSVWRATLAPGKPADQHQLDREHVVVLLAGRAVATLDEIEHPVAAGDAIVVPPHQRFSLANPYDEPCEVVAVLPVGGRARMVAGGDWFTPPHAE